jgi:hypothetical protein
VTERQAAVRLLKVPQADPGALRRACKRPLCGNEIDPPVGRSRPREFCSDSCRALYQRERDQARSGLLEARRLAAQYEVDDTAGDSPRRRKAGERPADRDGLSAATASYLALALVAQALESARVDMRDGTLVAADEVLARITRAKEEGDRLLQAYGP